MSRVVTLFKVTKDNVIAYGETIPMMVYHRPSRSFNSNDFFLVDDIKTQYNARVYRICDSHKADRFIAFDRDLEQIVEFFKDEAYRKGFNVGQCNTSGELIEEIKRLQSRTIWSMIVDKFKRSKPNGS